MNTYKTIDIARIIGIHVNTVRLYEKCGLIPKPERLQQQLLIQAKSKNDYEDVADEIYRLRELKQNALAENAEREGKRQRIAEMTDFLNEQSCELEEYDEQLVRRLIEKVTIYEDKLTVEFKSGIEIDEEI